MATFLSKIFKPKWQSNNFETRKHAVKLLDGLKAEDLKILIQLAEKDPSSEIQELAIQKVSDTEALISLHKQANNTLKANLEKRLYELASAQALSIFDLILDLDLLTEMIIKSNHADSYIRGLARIENTQVLLKIASQSRNSQIRQAAAELIESEKELNELFIHAKNKDKTVYHISKNKLAEIRALAQKDADNQEKVTKLLKDLGNLSQTEALQHFDARLAHLIKQWTVISAIANDAQSKEFSELSSLCKNKLKSVEASSENKLAVDTSETKDNEQQEADNEISATLSTITDTLVRFQKQAAKNLEIPALDALIKTQENRWLEATREADVNKLQQKTYLDGMIQLRHYLKAAHSLVDQSETLTSVSESLSQAIDLSPNELERLSKKLKNILKNIDWPNNYFLPELIIKAQNAMDISNERKQALLGKQKIIEGLITQQIEQMDTVLEDKQIKSAVKHLKDIQANLNKLETRQADRFQQGLALRINQLNELRDWQGFSNTPKQEELCDAMERLSETHIDPTEKAEKIKTMQHEWKNLGGTGNQDLWNRFKAAADRAYEPCALFFAEQKQLKQNNLNKRKTLLSQLKDYTPNVNWVEASSVNTNPTWTSSDWKAADKINRQARLEWKEAFPVDFKANKALQTEFNTIMDSFDQHLENERSYNLSLKQTIVDKAKALIEADDVVASIQTVKTLQDEWQKIGITHHKADRKLWAEYRTACDAVFAKRDQVREAKRSELDETIQTANATCSALEEASLDLSSKSSNELQNLLSENKKAAQVLPQLPTKVHEKIIQRMEAISSKINDELKQKDKQQKQAAWTEVARKSSVLKQAHSEISDTQNMLNEDRLSEIEQQLSSITELPKNLESKFNLIWQNIKEGKTELLNIINVNQAREICIACEIAAGLESPESDKALRMQLQVSRLSEGLSSGSENISRELQLENAMTNWYLSVGEKGTDLSMFESRVEAARNKLLV
jgi:exonuclease SbcC